MRTATTEKTIKQIVKVVVQEISAIRKVQAQLAITMTAGVVAEWPLVRCLMAIWVGCSLLVVQLQKQLRNPLLSLTRLKLLCLR